MARNINTCDSPTPDSIAPVVPAYGKSVNLLPGYVEGSGCVLRNWRKFYLSNRKSIVISNTRQNPTVTKKLYFEVTFTKVITDSGEGPFVGIKNWYTSGSKNIGAYAIGEGDFYRSAISQNYTIPKLKTNDVVMCYCEFSAGATTIGYIINNVDYGLVSMPAIPDNSFIAFVGTNITRDIVEGEINFGNKTLINIPPSGYVGWNWVDSLDEFATDSSFTLSNANKTIDMASTDTGFSQLSKSFFEGKYFIEFNVDIAAAGNLGFIGACNLNQTDPTDDEPTESGTAIMLSDGTFRFENGSASAYGSAFAVNDDILIYFDTQAGTIGFIQNTTDHGVAVTNINLSNLINYFFVGNRVANTGGFKVTINTTIINTPPSGYLQVNLDSTVFDEDNYLSKSPGFSDLINNTYSNRFLTVALGAADTYPDCIFSRIFTDSGKWYAEVTVDVAVNDNIFIGIGTPRHDEALFPGGTEFSIALRGSDGFIYVSGAQLLDDGRLFTAGDIIGVSVDQINKTISFNINNENWGTVIPYSFVGPVCLLVGRDDDIAKTFTINYGGSAFNGSAFDTSYIAWDKYFNSLLHIQDTIVNTTETNYPRLLYSNKILNNPVVTVSSENADHLKELSYDGLMGTFWQPNSGGDSWIKFFYSVAIDINTFGIFAHNLGDVNAVIQLFGSNDDITYTPLIQPIEPVSTELYYITIEKQTYNYFKLNINSLSSAEIGMISFGEDIIFQHQNEVGFTVPKFNDRAKLIPKGKGRDIAYQSGRSVRFKRTVFDIPSNDMTQCWSDANWLLALKQVRIQPYFYSHSQKTHPTEVVACYSEKTIRPTVYKKGWELNGEIPTIGYFSTPSVVKEEEQTLSSGSQPAKLIPIICFDTSGEIGDGSMYELDDDYCVGFVDAIKTPIQLDTLETVIDLYTLETFTQIDSLETVNII